uniref:Uncharacterized protein n=1 Tax=Brassica oleracea TaxID=3712 RepID=A0A3P6CU13_BRAOL|nr:unnamed protein product [Brassica oleracea]
MLLVDELKDQAKRDTNWTQRGRRRRKSYYNTPHALLSSAGHGILVVMISRGV